jgi:multidrug efflux pump subunit AcrA (membrane-fusion protein)
MFGKAVVRAQNKAGTTNITNNLVIPYDALLDADGSTGYVFVTNDNKTAHKLKVTVSGIEKNNVLISDGLQNINAVIIAGSAYLTEGSKIKIVE